MQIIVSGFFRRQRRKTDALFSYPPSRPMCMGRVEMLLRCRRRKSYRVHTWAPPWLPQNCTRSQRGLTIMIPSFRFLSSSVELYFTVFGTDRLTNTRPAIYYMSYQIGLNAHFLRHVFLSVSNTELLRSSVHLR